MSYNIFNIICSVMVFEASDIQYIDCLMLLSSALSRPSFMVMRRPGDDGFVRNPCLDLRPAHARREAAPGARQTGGTPSFPPSMHLFAVTARWRQRASATTTRRPPLQARRARRSLLSQLDPCPVPKGAYVCFSAGQRALAQG